MLKNYSSEYASIIAMLIAPQVGTVFSDACAGEVSTWVGTTVVTLIAGAFLLIKRYTRGGVTPLGIRK